MYSMVFTFTLTLLGAIQAAALQVSGTEVALTVKPGSDITLYGDCTWTSGSKMYWYRNCLHCRKPSFAVLTSELVNEASFPQFKAYVNSTSRSHDLLIKNITESELGVYYCCVVETKLKDNILIKQKEFHSFGNITYKLTFDTPVSSPVPSCPPPPPPDCGQCRMLLVSLCPFSALVSALMTFLCMQLLWNKTGSFQEQDRKNGGRSQVLSGLMDVDEVYTEVSYKLL